LPNLGAVLTGRWRAAFAVASMFVVILVVGSPLAESERAPVSTMTSGHTSEIRDAASSPTISSATTPSRRLMSASLFVGYLHTAQSVALALLLWIASALAGWALLLGVGRVRRGRGPPLSYA
jgi:hypothetical protein